MNTRLSMTNYRVCWIWLPYLLLQSTRVQSQTTFPRLAVGVVVDEYQGLCAPRDIEACKTGCAPAYQDPKRVLCPCYGKMFQCLIEIGCDLVSRKSVVRSCTRTGYCKHSRCVYRSEGEVTPRREEAKGRLLDLITPVASQACVGSCGHSSLSERKQQILDSRNYRHKEPSLPPRREDPRLGTNQAHDGNPYSLSLSNLTQLESGTSVSSSDSWLRYIN